MKREKAGFFLCFKKIFSEDIFFFSENVFAKRQDISETFSLSVRLCRYDFRIDDDCVVLCKKNILFIEITRKIFAESIFFVYLCRVINLKKLSFIKRTLLLIALCSAFLFSCNEAEKSDDVVYNDYPDIEGVYHLEMTGRLLESGFTVGVGTPYYSDCRLCIYKKSDGLYSAAYYESADELSFPLKDEVFLTVTKNNDVRGIVPYFIYGASGAPIEYPALYKGIELIGYYNPNGVISGDYCGYVRGSSGSNIAPATALKAIGTFVMTKESDIPENFREQIKEEEGL